MMLYLTAILAGFLLLVWGADRVVLGASAIARHIGVSPMLIGLTVVGFATSLPEIFVSATAALAGAPNLAIGNALGSNVANIGLVIGIAALTHPLASGSSTLRRELPVMLAVSILPAVLFPDGVLSRLDGWLLLVGLVAFMIWIVRLGRSTHGIDPIEAQYAAELPSGVTLGRASIAVLIGLVTLLAGANALVWGSESVAKALGISDLVLGVTIVAVGTSLPELAVSIVSARKGEHGLALGNVIGSNAFNLLAVIGVAATIEPARLEPDAVKLHLPVMVGFTLAFFFIAYNRDNVMRVGRLAGGALFVAFCCYHAVVIWRTIQTGPGA
jgi:cation:H+ antiporter